PVCQGRDPVPDRRAARRRAADSRWRGARDDDDPAPGRLAAGEAGIGVTREENAVLEVPRRRPPYATPARPARRPRRPAPALPAQARRAGVRLVRFLYTDNGGITRGKA